MLETAEQVAIRKQTQKTEILKWKETHSGLKNKAMLFQRDIDTLLNHPRMIELRNDITDCRKSDQIVKLTETKEKQRIKQCLEDLKLEMKRLMESISEAETRKQLSSSMSNKPEHLEVNQRRFDKLLSTVRVLMEKIDSNIMQFKQEEKEKYEPLNVEEKLLGRDLVQFEEKIKAWEQEQKEEPKSILDNPYQMHKIDVMNRKKLKEESVPSQVNDFKTFLVESGGMNGGWDERDHAQFLRIRAKVRGNKDQLFTLASQQIPDKDYVTVQEHEEFYEKLLLLQERKREAIKKWRETREKQKIESFEVSEEEKIRKLQEYEEKKQIMERKQREATKRKLDAWKETKEQQVLELEEEEKAKREEEQRRKENEVRKRREEARIVLEELRNQREEKHRLEREQMIQEMENKQQRPASPGEIERLRQREEEYMQRMNFLRNRKFQAQMEREERIRRMSNQVRVEAERDFSRVLQPTTSQQNRVKELKKEGPDNATKQFNFDIRRVQHRIQPSWRSTS